MSWYRMTGGSGTDSLILPTNPILSIKEDDSKLIVSWTQPSTEVAIEKYNIYKSTTKPSKLSDMELVGETTELNYELTGLTNRQIYYIGIQAVSIEGYENASMWEIKEGTPYILRFVCVGNSGLSYYSTDGKNWISMGGLESSYGYYGVTYGPHGYVCVGDYGDSFYSIDGLTWQPMTGIDKTVSYYVLNSVAYNKMDSMYVAVGNYFSSYYSINGKTWILMGTRTSYNGDSFEKIIALPEGGFVAVGADRNKKTAISYTTLNSRTWIKTTALSVNDTLGSIAYGNGKFVATSKSGYYFYYSTSLTGKWVATSKYTYSYGLPDIIYAKGMFVSLYGGNPSAFYSLDGVNWENSKLSSKCYGLTYYGDRFVAVGESGNSYYSLDGINWVAMSGLNNARFYAVAGY